MKATIYSAKGKEAGSIELPDAVFGVKRNSALVHQVVTAMEANARTPVAHTKGRSDVRGGGKKPWAQKGTGRARHGSIRSPIFRGGGVTHGPLKEKNYSEKINRKMSAKALATTISDKVRATRFMLVDDLGLSAPKTRDARTLLSALGGVKGYAEVGTRRKNAVLFAVTKKTDSVVKSFRNMQNVAVVETRNLNPVDVLKYRFLVLVNPEEGVKTLTARITK